MSIPFMKLDELTKDECEACQHYRSDATFLHACAQGWGGEFRDSATLQSFLGKAPQLVKNLDQAIQKFELAADGTVYSGHGRGTSVIGSLVGQPSRFAGLTYQYFGFISTSEHRDAAENFLRTRASGARVPVLLEIRLKKGHHAVPMDHITGQAGEGEFLLARSVKFQIIASDFIRIPDVGQDVLRLVLS